MERKTFTNDDIISMLDEMDNEERIKTLARFQCLYQTKTVEETAERIRDFLNLYMYLYMLVFNKVSAVCGQLVEVIKMEGIMIT